MPDFTKAELSFSRTQGITNDRSLLASTTGQWVSGVMYSSEQFGYGGPDFGLAYDSSDITGDKGVAGSLELPFGGWSAWQPVSLQPYGFYDIGTVSLLAAARRRAPPTSSAIPSPAATARSGQ